MIVRARAHPLISPITIFAIGIILALLAAQQLCAQTYSVLYAFQGGNDGADPSAELIQDKSGNLYGTTYVGGPSNWGTVYRIDPAGNETVLYAFNDLLPDGAYPRGGLVMDHAGNLFGTNSMEGNYRCGGFLGCGTVFKIDPSGAETVLFTFARKSGSDPTSSLVMDGGGNFFGTATTAGAYNRGTVFKIDPTGNETVLYSFKGSDGGTPLMAKLAIDTFGNLYGTTLKGGSIANAGTVFRLTPNGQETVLHRFGGPDGSYPNAGVVRDSQGNLFGTTVAGGTFNSGTVFKIDNRGNEQVLYSFSGGIDGLNPVAGLVLDAAGNLYGTTYGGGTTGYGTVFKVDSSGHETILHSFGTQQGDGIYPYSSLLLDASGTLYGTTLNGGATCGCGVVYKIAP